MSLFGTTVKAIKITVAVIALSLLSHTVSASDEEPYPIWWSPSLELESLDQIDKRLEKPFWPDDEGFVMGKWDVDRYSVKDLAPNCATMLDLAEKGYSSAGSCNDIAIQTFFMAECEALRYLKSAQPAKRSYLVGFALDRESFQFLPPMVDLGISCQSICWRYYANEERRPMGEPEPLRELEIVNDHEMAFKTDFDGGRMEILARADFNRDGSDDILLRSGAYVFEGTWAVTKLFLLTRDAPGSVLRVVNPDRYLCTHYQCDPADYYGRE